MGTFNLIVWLIFSVFIVCTHCFVGLSRQNRWFSRCLSKPGTTITASPAKKLKPKKVLDMNMFSTSEYVPSSDSDSLSFTIYGEPQVLERHRTLKTGMIYNPSAKKQELFKAAAKKHLPSVPFNCSLEVNLLFYFSRPKNHYGCGSKSDVLKADKTDIYHNTRKGIMFNDSSNICNVFSDLDNLIKFVLDSLNKVAYDDDSQVAMISGAKLYADRTERERIEIRIRKLNNSDAIVNGNFGK